jgi:hypothetical protein
MTGERGGIFTDVTVPDFVRAPISVAGPLVQVGSGAGALPAGAFADVMPIVPTTQRTFAASDRVTVFMRVYQGQGAIRPVRVTSEVQDATGRGVTTAERVMETGEFGAARSADYRWELPLRGLVAGEYVLTIRCSRGQASIERPVRFRVR